MNSLGLLVVTLAVGVDYGWQPVAGGGIEYIIQIEPAALEALRSGEDLLSDLPPYLRNVRSYRITVGTSALPHQGEPPPPSELDSPSAAAAELPSFGTDGGKLTAVPPLMTPMNEVPPQTIATPLTTATPPTVAEPRSATPHSFDPVPSSPVVLPASGTSVETPPQPKQSKAPPADARVLRIETEKPWMPFTLALVGLFVSLGANAYLGWLNVDLRAKYRSALAGWKR